MDAMTKMWVSFWAIGLMVSSAVIISFARSKTKGWIRVVLTIVAVFILLIAMLLGLMSIL